ncbi:ATP-grasp domain-containing protein [Sporosarcina sp. Marseille-Q4943]|uniref:ATP-grasp domain-containing protein n=1 Tax=Sporosarcina sp. Marseille-Q4943 TaxID=2942204 RepID=UPI00208DBF52|nr:ATP-grasp domain-containing protein [Sporosarcina sp. Marseille-Q4943]
MRAIVFIGSSTTGSSIEALAAASRLGYAAILMTNRKEILRRRPGTAQIILMDSLEKGIVREKIVQLIQSGYDIKVIISFVDPYVSMAAELSNEFCGSSISFKALQLMEDKMATRLTLENNRATCLFELIPIEPLKPSNIKFPFIMKKTVSNGSKDIYYIENEIEFENNVQKLAKRKPGKQFIVEEFIEGPQYVIEVVVIEGIPIIVAVIQQEITQDYTFIVTAYDVVMEIDEEIYRSLWKTVTSIINEMGLQNGACHIEMRLSPNGWKLIEMNPRISGGAMNRMIEEAFGINLVQETIKLYLGEEPDLIRKKQQCVHTSYITISSTGYLLEIEGVEEAANCPGVADVFVKPSIGTIMMPPLSMGHRYGYVMAVGESTEEAKERAENAARLIKFYIEPL